MKGRERLYGALLLAGVIFLVVVAAYFLIVSQRDQRNRDQVRNAIIQELDYHRCRTEQIEKALLESHGLPYPPYPDNVEPPANCPVVDHRSEPRPTPKGT